MNKKKKSWFREHWDVVAVGVISILAEATSYYLYGRLKERCSDLEKENQRLEKENADLNGQIHANERENRRLNRENGNLNYQLGKMVASKK